jgi:hypothetical protein
MISFIQPIAAGNALRVFMEPPAGAVWCRLLRKGSDTFTDQDDPTALLVQEGTETVAVDVAYLTNGTPYYYKPFYRVGAGWVAGATVAGTPAAGYEDGSTDVLSLVRDRLDAGLAVEIERGTLAHPDGHIRVLTAPPLFDDVVMPLVTVHLQSEDPKDRALGELAAVDEFDAIGGEWTESEGWLAGVQLSVMGWSLNPDERIDLRKALRRIVVANLPVFAAAGMVEVQFSQQDTEDFASFSAPIYQTLGTLTCEAPVLVGNQAGAIQTVTQTIVE